VYQQIKLQHIKSNQLDRAMLQSQLIVIKRRLWDLQAQASRADQVV